MPELNNDLRRPDFYDDIVSKFPFTIVAEDPAMATSPGPLTQMEFNGFVD